MLFESIPFGYLSLHSSKIPTPALSSIDFESIPEFKFNLFVVEFTITSAF